MVSGLGVCALMVECVSVVLLMTRLVTNLPTDGLDRSQEQQEVGNAASSRGREGEYIERLRFLVRLFCGQVSQ